MVAELVDKLLLAVSGSRVTEIEYQANGVRLRLVLREGKPGIAPPRPHTGRPVDEPAPGERPLDRHVVVAGMHGTFYRASAPEQPPLVEAGQHVEAGQSLGLIESMKMLNSVESEHAGRVVEVLASNGALVEPDSPLFVIEAGNAGHV